MKKIDENLQEQEQNKKNEIVNNKGKVLEWIENVLFLINKYGFKKIIQAMSIVAMAIFFITFIDAVREDNLIKEIMIQGDDAHIQASNARKEIDPKINKTLTRMLYSMQADRVGILEMHNGKENPTSLPFLYCDMTYEEARENVAYIADEYENLNMSKFQFPSFLYKNKIFFGTVEDVMEIDKKLGLRLQMNDVQYIGMVLIRTSTDIGFTTISWMKEPTMSRDAIIADLTYYVQELGTYLDYGQYKLLNQ